MENKTNSAIRLKNIIKKAYNNQNKSTLKVWEDVFQINEKDTHSTKISVIFCIDNLKDEFVIFKDNMSNSGFSTDLYDKEIHLLQNHLVEPTSAVIGDWQAKKRQITDVQFKILDFCSAILPNDEILINNEEIEKLQELINELEEFINSESLDNDLNKLIKKHLAKIKSALYTYELHGANVFDDVLESAYGEILKNPIIFKDTSEAKNKLSNMWKLTQNLYKKAKNIHTVYIDFNNMSTTIQNLISN